eukprot:364539-Chlamydomonas_euryale.AAC.7
MFCPCLALPRGISTCHGTSTCSATATHAMKSAVVCGFLHTTAPYKKGSRRQVCHVQEPSSALSTWSNRSMFCAERRGRRMRAPAQQHPVLPDCSRDVSTFSLGSRPKPRALDALLCSASCSGTP